MGSSLLRLVAAQGVDVRGRVIDFGCGLGHLLERILERGVAATGEGRMVTMGGFLVVSTPNDEHLARSQTMCPDCGGRFHQMQHVRSWMARSLSAFTGGLRPWTGKRRPHLVYVGRKR